MLDQNNFLFINLYWGKKIKGGEERNSTLLEYIQLIGKIIAFVDLNAEWV